MNIFLKALKTSSLLIVSAGVTFAIGFMACHFLLKIFGDALFEFFT